MSKLKIGFMLTLFIIIGVIVYLFVYTGKDEKENNKVVNNNYDTYTSTSTSNEAHNSMLDSVISAVTEDAKELLSEINRFFSSKDGFSVSNVDDLVTIKYDIDGFISYVEINISNGINPETKATYTQLNKDSTTVLYTREFKYSNTSFSGVNEFTISNYLQSVNDILKDSYSGFIHEGD